ncbi:hypothetical protein EV361DRAFT_584504 [Lentinula raphanica]|nr:hypothetical protein EV361DRAFT_584504 [Lentinula raphanica]
MFIWSLPETHFSYFSLHSASPSRPFESFSPDSNRVSSPISLPEVRISRYTLPEFYRPPSPHPHSDQSSINTYPFASMPVATEELPVTDAPPRIPRPPNAFMLFRSNMLKTKAIPATAERRQQQLSKVAGECWNLMSPEEKQVWHDEAARRMREHQLKYPNYKFAPVTRGTGRKSKKDAEQSARTDKDRVRELREKWTHVYGPAATPSRRKKLRTKDHLLSKSEPDSELESLSDDRALASFTPSTSPFSSSTTSSSVGDGSLPPVFPNPSYPHYSESQPYNVFANQYPITRPPSTSSNSSCNGSVISSGSSFDAPSFSPSHPTYYSPHSDADAAICAGIDSLDITPTAATFQRSDLQPSTLLRHNPSFLSLTNGRASSEPPFLFPLATSTPELRTNSVGHEHTSAGSAPTSFAPNFSYESLKPDASNSDSFNPFPFKDDSKVAGVGDWNFASDFKFF